eukprot:XP_004914938.1 PREDICTED: uncharacterized protein LOC101731881 [Xenopus tropicalis]
MEGRRRKINLPDVSSSSDGSQKFTNFENEALIEALVPVYERVIGRYAARTPTAVKAKAWKDIAEAVNSVAAAATYTPGDRIDTDRNVGQDSSPPGLNRRRQTASAPVPGGRSSSRLDSPQRDPEFEREGFSGEESERGSHVGGSDVALFSDEEPTNVPQQQQIPTQAQDRVLKTLIKHHKMLMRKLDVFHSDLCVATQAYNEAQARQAAHESAMRRHEAAMLSLEEEKVELKRQKVALLAEQNALQREQVAAIKQQGQKPTEPTSLTSSCSSTTAPPPPGSTRQLRKRK